EPDLAHVVGIDRLLVGPDAVDRGERAACNPERHICVVVIGDGLDDLTASASALAATTDLLALDHPLLADATHPDDIGGKPRAAEHMRDHLSIGRAQKLELEDARTIVAHHLAAG